MIENEKSNLQAVKNKGIQDFLNKFVLSTNVDSTTFDFKSNPNVYIVESQLPELWLKSKKPFDKNKIFIDYRYKVKHQENYFPSTSFILPGDVSISSKAVSIGKLDIDDLFGLKTTYKVIDVFGEEFSKETKQTEIPKKEEEKPVIEEDKDDQIFMKKWFLSFKNIHYGPYTGEEIYIFLNNLYKNKNIKCPDFMVADSESDFYFKPESIYEIFSENPKLKEKTAIQEKETDLKKATLSTKDSSMILMERKFSENPKLITKFDVVELNSKYKDAQYLPLKQLKKQLNELKLNHNDSNVSNVSREGLKFPPTPTSLIKNDSRKTPQNKFEISYNLSLSNSQSHVESSNRIRMDNIKNTSMDLRNKFSNAARLNENFLNKSISEKPQTTTTVTNISTDQLFA